MKNLKMILIGTVVMALLIISNLVFELYPSTKYAVIAFDLLLFIVILRFAFIEIRQMIRETSIRYVACTLVASLVVLCLVVWLVA